jgi:uncharacterized protein YbjT (DUF2867 family)
MITSSREHLASTKGQNPMILVVGATGTLGGMITRRLLEQGRNVRILVRNGSNYDALVKAGAETTHGDLKDRASLDKAVQGIDTVVTTANSALRGGADNVESVEIQGNRSLIDAARGAGVRHFILTSAIGAAAGSPVPFLRGKGLTEAHLKVSRMGYTILSPNIFMEVWFPMIVGIPLQSGAPVTIIGEGKRRHSFVSMTDVAAFATAAVENSAARNQQIFIGGPEALSWADVVKRAGEVLGRELTIRRVQPGEPLPGLPDVASGLLAGMDTYDSPVDMTATAQTYGVDLSSAEQVLRQILATV